jgi:hypothetical protein
MRDPAHIGFSELAALAYEFPGPIIAAAAAGREHDLAAEFRDYPELGLLDFGNRLVLIAGLALSALYVDALRRDPAARDALLHDYVRTILGGRGMDRGLACSVVHRAGVLNVKPFAKLVDDDSPVTNFITSRPAGAGNIFRAQMDESLESQLARLIVHLRFLKSFSFEDSGVAVFDDEGEKRQIDLWPFLLWDGRLLQRFVECPSMEHGVVWSTFADGEDVRHPPRKLPQGRRNQFRATLALVGSTMTVESTAPDLHYEESVIPLFADTHPYMDKLAQRLFDSSDVGTRARLWVAPFFQNYDRLTWDEANEHANDQVLVTNAIIKKCMDTDPVTVMTDYFEAEPEKERKYFELLLGKDRKRIDQILDELDAAVKSHRERQSLYCRPEDENALNNNMKIFHRRLVARRIVHLMGFQIVEQKAQDDIDDYVAQVSAFHDFIREGSAQPLLVAGGLIKCAAIGEEILKFLIAFYTAMKYYEPMLAEGLDEPRVAHLETNLAFVFGGVRGLSDLATKFDDLAKNEEIGEAVEIYLGRDVIWPHEKAAKAIGGLRNLNQYRNKNAHEVPVSDVEKAPATIKRFLNFLEWLRDPTERSDDAGRIYPAILQLNTITMNHCGITSVKHNLTTRGSSRPITLYTRQPLSVYAGTFYGVPQKNKALKDLWLDPVLIPTRIFSDILTAKPAKLAKRNAR